MTSSQSGVEVVVVPFPAQGHLTPLLRLARRLSSHNIPVHFIASATHLRQATARADPSPATSTTNLHFHTFPTPPFQNLPPISNSYPSHLRQMIAAVISHFHHPFQDLINKLASKNAKRIVLIFDSLMASAVQSAHSSTPIVESYCFESISAFTLYWSHQEVVGSGAPSGSRGSKTVGNIVIEELPSSEGCCSEEFKEFLKFQQGSRTFHSGTIYNSSRLVEGSYLDLLSELNMFGVNKHYSLGPLNPVFPHEKPGSTSHSACLEWLDRQPKDSVLFVSFGTSSSLSGEQISELALGLERSGQRFIWAFRDADRGDIFERGDRRDESSLLPEGFQERVKNRGIFATEWAPQIEILGHSSTGGFLSHCGWNSCMESLSMGMPMAAWPMHSDQPRNAFLITNVIRVGVRLRDWARREELVSSFSVEEGVRRLMASPEGEEMRQRAKKLADSIKRSMMEGGEAKIEMDSFIAHITR